MPSPTQRKKLRQDLFASAGTDFSRRELERYEEVLWRSRSALWEVDAQGIFTYVSRSMELLLGYSSEELVGKRHIDSFYPAGMETRLAEELTSEWLKREAPFYHPECPLMQKDGRVVWVASHGFPIFDRRGLLLGYRGTDIDVTHLRDDGMAGRAQAAGLERLNFRERQVLWGVAHGLLNKQIAARCGLAERTVKMHRASLTRKSGIFSAAGLALFARDSGLMGSPFPDGPFHG